MGHRELKRVPLNFNWQLRKVWKGYLNPYPGPKECSNCSGSGYNEATKKIADDYYDFKNTGRAWNHNITQDEVEALVRAGRLMDFTNVPINKEQIARL